MFQKIVPKFFDKTFANFCLENDDRKRVNSLFNVHLLQVFEISIFKGV